MKKLDVKNFLNLNNLKKLNKNLENYVDRNNDKLLKVEHNCFMPIHRVGYGLNGDTKLVEFIKCLTEANFVYVDRGFSFNYACVYIRSTTNSGELSRFVEFRDNKNKRITRSNLSVDDMKYLFGRVHTTENECSEEDTERFYEDLVSARWSIDLKKLSSFVESKGFKLIRTFVYHKKISFTPKFIREGKNSIEFGWETNFTYYSHPNTLKITKAKEVKIIPLKDIGAEFSGYYDHHIKMNIRPEQVNEVSRFAKNFNRKSK